MAVFISIDLKSFYASCECVDHKLDPLNTNLVVADASRTEKTICLAVSPSLKAIGVPGRPRLFEVIEIVENENARRRRNAPGQTFSGASCLADELARDPGLALSYIIAPPQMKRYMDISAQIYEIYLRYIAPEDIHVYSVDEVFIDAEAYLNTYHCTAHELAMRLIRDVLAETGITATAGVGTNLYLAKVAMDIVAKKMPPDKDGVRIAELDEMAYRRLLWDHTPLTDFWRVGHGTARRLASLGVRSMGELARLSEYGEDRLYKLFGVNAETLIDHAWGWEPCTMAAIKSYQPASHSISQGQVLPRAYSAEQGRLICREMTDQVVLELVSKRLVTDQIVLHICYDHTGIPEDYKGDLVQNHYGRTTPKPVHGSVNLGSHISSSRRIIEAIMGLYDRIVDPELSVRRLNITANHVLPESEAAEQPVQYSLFDDVEVLERKRQQERSAMQRERRLQEAVLRIKGKYGKNAILKGMNFEDGATARERNAQVGGHRA